MFYSMLLKRLFGAFREVPPDPEGRPEGLVLVADGVGGLDLCGSALRRVLAREGLGFQVKVLSWGHGMGRWHADLTNVKNRDAQARRMAEDAQAFRADHPDAPVCLVGKSGGTGVVVKALEILPADAVSRVVLIAPALSPNYDLTLALRAAKGAVTVFWSPLDVIVLGAGTRVFGTVDGVRGVSAGLVGFRVPEPSAMTPEQARQYAKLRQVRWRPAMATTGYLGGHVGTDMPAFLRKYVVPLLAAAKPLAG